MTLYDGMSAGSSVDEEQRSKSCDGGVGNDSEEDGVAVISLAPMDTEDRNQPSPRQLESAKDMAAWNMIGDGADGSLLYPSLFVYICFVRNAFSFLFLCHRERYSREWVHALLCAVGKKVHKMRPPLGIFLNSCCFPCSFLLRFYGHPFLWACRAPFLFLHALSASVLSELSTL